MKRRTILVYLLLLSVVIAGIAFAVTRFNLLVPKSVNVSGTITRDGKPLEWKSSELEKRQFVVNFLPEPRDIDSLTYIGLADAATGKYEVHGIPPGRYKVQIADRKSGV